MAQAIGSTRNVLRDRMKNLGLKPFVEEVGEDRLRIILPLLSDQELFQARDHLFKRAVLEFRLVHPNSEALIQQGVVLPDYELLDLKHRSKDGVETVEPLLVKRHAERGLTGQHVQNAFVVSSPAGEPRIGFQLDSQGAAAFAEVTRENIGNRLAIVLDGDLYSAPVIRSEIPGGSGEISGNFSIQEAYELVNALRHPFPFPIRIVDEKKY